MSAEVDVSGERLILRADRSLHWPRGRMLVIADPHFGKADAFRAEGVPALGDESEPLARLATALVDTGAGRLVVLGDFWHSSGGRTVRVASALAAWRADRVTIQIEVVRGNHDRAGSLPPGWGDWATDLVVPPFAFSHFPDPSDRGYVLAGHLHPGVVLGRERLRLPCFWFGARVGVLPAFGAFTGVAGVPASRGERVFAVAGDTVVDVSRNG